MARVEASAVGSAVASEMATGIAAGMQSVPNVVEVRELMGKNASAPSLVVEVPHGAAGAAEYDAVARHLQSPLPANLDHFFHVNTDAGAWELGVAIAERMIAAGQLSRAVLVRSCIPRTFIDCNRVLDVGAEAYRAGGVTPGVPPWITADPDHAFLRARYAAYQAVAAAAIGEVGAAGGAILLLHTYATRTVDVQVTPQIVADLHAAYAPDQVGRWPLRPEVDLIHRTQEGVGTVSEAAVSALRTELAAVKLELAEGATYPLHPVTTAFGFVQRFPGQAACVEVRRDLLTEAFVPFVEVVPSEPKVGRVASAFAAWIASGALQRA